MCSCECSWSEDRVGVVVPVLDGSPIGESLVDGGCSRGSGDRSNRDDGNWIDRKPSSDGHDRPPYALHSHCVRLDCRVWVHEPHDWAAAVSVHGWNLGP